MNRVYLTPRCCNGTNWQTSFRRNRSGPITFSDAVLVTGIRPTFDDARRAVLFPEAYV